MGSLEGGLEEERRAGPIQASASERGASQSVLPGESREVPEESRDAPDEHRELMEEDAERSALLEEVLVILQTGSF